MITLEGVAYLTSGATNVVTVVTKINNGFKIKYYYLGIADWTTEENDVERCIKHGSSLHAKAGEAILECHGSPMFKKYKEKIDSNINLRRIQ